MKLHCLGTIGYHESEKGRTPCFMVPELGIIFDGGSGFFRVAKLIQTPEIDIFISHAHLDHICGLMVCLEISLTTKTKIRLHANQDVIDSVKTILSRPVFPVDVPIEYLVLTPEIKLNNGVKVTSFDLKHCGQCQGFRVDHPDCSFAYLTDTTSNAESKYIENVKGIDLLIHECYCTKDQIELAPQIGHSSVVGLKEFIDKAQPKKLVVTHHSPSGDWDKMKSELDELIPGYIFAYDTLVVDLN